MRRKVDCRPLSCTQGSEATAVTEPRSAIPLVGRKTQRPSQAIEPHSAIASDEVSDRLTRGETEPHSAIALGDRRDLQVVIGDRNCGVAVRFEVILSCEVRSMMQRSFFAFHFPAIHGSPALCLLAAVPAIQ